MNTFFQIYGNLSLLAIIFIPIFFYSTSSNRIDNSSKDEAQKKSEKAGLAAIAIVMGFVMTLVAIFFAGVFYYWLFSK
jgi:hypothetical protein